MHIKILLEEIRKRRKISLEELAYITGISKTHLYYIEKQQREPTLSIIIRIAKALNIDEKELYEVEENIDEV